MTEERPEEAVEAVVPEEETPVEPTAGVFDFSSRKVRLENGIVLKVKPVPSMMLRRLALEIPEPEPPIVEIGDGKTEPNPNDPDYVEALEACYEQRIAKTTEAMYVFGSEIDSVPEGMWHVNDSQWVEEFESMGIPVRATNPRLRYLDYLSFYALTTQMDQSALYMFVIAQMGVLDWEVRKAIEYFRRKSMGLADNGIPAGEGDPDGDRVPEAGAGADTGV